MGFGPTIDGRNGTALRADVRVLDLAVGVRLAPHLGLAFGALGADFHPDISEHDGGVEYPALQAYAFGNLGTEVNTAKPMWYGYVRGSPGGFGSSFLRVGTGMSLVVGPLNPCAELTYRRLGSDSDVRSSVSLLVRCGIGGWYDF